MEYTAHDQAASRSVLHRHEWNQQSCDTMNGALFHTSKICLLLVGVRLISHDLGFMLQLRRSVGGSDE